jgi:hypothetical protein
MSDETSLSKSEVEAALTQMSPADWKRIKIKARTYSKALTYLTADDIIQEALISLLSGDRVWPRSARSVIVVINAMHSEASNCREREQSGAIDHRVDISVLSQQYDEDAGTLVMPINEVTPERIVESRGDIEAIERLVENDEELQDVVLVWSLGIRGKDAAIELGWEMNKYEAARKRLTRLLESL